MAENFEDVIDMDAGFDYGSEPYMFEPEYTDQELFIMEQQALQQQQQQQDDAHGETRQRQLADPREWCNCQNKRCSKMPYDEECLCCSEFYLWRPENAEGETDLPCLTTHEDFIPLINRGVLETFFLSPRINWEERPTPEGPDGHLSNE